MSPNMNPVTGIRYGIISADSLDPDVINEIQSRGTDVHWERHVAEVRALCEQSVKDGELSADDLELQIEHKLEYDRWYDDEPVHEFKLDGVIGQITWLGGALLAWVFESEYIASARVCSPCVPWAGDLDNIEYSSLAVKCYDVNPEWRNENE